MQFGKQSSLIVAQFLNKNIDTGVTAVCLHPGVVYTEIIRNDTNTSYLMRFINGWSWLYFRYLGLSSAQGAVTSIYCATSDDIPNHPGAYYK